MKCALGLVNEKSGYYLIKPNNTLQNNLKKRSLFALFTQCKHVAGNKSMNSTLSRSFSKSTTFAQAPKMFIFSKVRRSVNHTYQSMALQTAGSAAVLIFYLKLIHTLFTTLISVMKILALLKNATDYKTLNLLLQI